MLLCPDMPDMPIDIITDIFFSTYLTYFQAFKLDVGEDFDTSTVSAAEARDLFSCELTKYEFADALSLKHTSLFVENMFVLVDKDNNGYISFREFLDVIVMFRAGEISKYLPFDNLPSPQKTRDVLPLLINCWPRVAELMLGKQHWGNVSCFLGQR